MLFKCGHNHANGAHHAPASDAGAGAVRVDKLGVRTVDIHCHLHVPEVDGPKMWLFALPALVSSALMVTIVPGAPTMWTAFAHFDELHDNTFASVRRALSGASRLPVSVAERMRDR